ncbi:L,D-transpeptidase [Thiorhodococcus mannitoliphagus]|uniref:L,D-transpeptidase n=2 Tax=Thiorhodococcus mannitoliphagus TaxID=329406 RepID=A0A6P1DU87_9GAMM|nr:L,D-transpeptidase [Thiorhodococcus mannitoliphagus]
MAFIPKVTANEFIKEIGELKPGEFTWHPDRSPHGPVAVVVSLPEQRVHVYRNGIRIAVSTCSTGKPGHETPTGVFTVLQKDKDHHSSTYNNAPMPNMNRLTWDGVALHAGKLPGYPASHGCVRLPMTFSAKLWTVTHVGTPVIIAGTHSDPWELTHPGMVLGAYAEDEFEHVVASLGDKPHPADWEEGQAYPIMTVVASTADRKIDLLEDGRVVAEGRLSIQGSSTPVGSHVLILKGAHAGSKGLAWQAISHHEHSGGSVAGADVTSQAIVSRLKSDDSFQHAMKERMHPGMVMIVTDTPLHADRRSGKDFVIMSSA